MSPAEVTLDGCCGAGGAARGLAKAGHYVIGVDVRPKLRDAYLRSGAAEFICADILEMLADASFMSQFDLAHCSFPCQPHTDLKNAWNAHHHDDLIPSGRKLLEAWGGPWVIENVPGSPLRNPVTLCGCMFRLGSAGYRLERKRLFESSFPLAQPACACAADPRPVVGIYGGKVRNRRAIASGSQRSRGTSAWPTGRCGVRPPGRQPRTCTRPAGAGSGSGWRRGLSSATSGRACPGSTLPASRPRSRRPGRTRCCRSSRSRCPARYRTKSSCLP